jgi:GTP cyclohydrolase I
VGISDLCYPIVVLDRRAERQSTVARIHMAVDLPRNFRGTHMSRFIEVLNRHHGEITARNIGPILGQIADGLEARSAHIDIAFAYFIEKEAPVSGARSLMDYPCRFVASHDRTGKDDFVLEVTVPVMNLCPCSKRISRSAAHNQRSEVTVRLRTREFVWIEEVIDWVEAAASTDLYALLKREDEKAVVERAYRHPRFVEDVVRILALRLMDDDRITWFHVRAKNFESIHNHNAYALIERDKRTATGRSEGKGASR